MELKEYQARALETAKPTALNEAYLAPMIVGEAGELFGAFAKSVRDGWGEERLRSTLIKEYGDICWGVAVAMSLVGVDDSIIFEEASYGPLEDWIMKYAHEFYWSCDAKVLQVLWSVLRDQCDSFLGLSFDEVLEANLAKLADRQARGVISGSGDTR